MRAIFDSEQSMYNKDSVSAKRKRSDRADSAAAAPVHPSLRLQRLIGNRAFSQIVIQRKPADIDQTQKLEYDTTGKFTNDGAARAAGSTPTKRINAQLTRGWVLPNQQLIGGHLFTTKPTWCRGPKRPRQTIQRSRRTSKRRRMPTLWITLRRTKLPSRWT
jgi:hypothetical protein